MAKEISLEGFPSVTKEEWKALAQKQLRAEDPSSLNWQADGAISLEPYYDHSDLSDLKYLEDFFKGAPSFDWKLYERIVVEDEQPANQKALEALEGGCNGVIFQLDKKVDEAKLMNDILNDICDVCTEGSWSSKTLVSKEGYFSGGDDTNAISLHDCVTQVESILKVLNSLGEAKHILRRADSDFFLEIASIRAMRFLISDHLSIDPWKIQIHTTVPLHSEADHQWFLNSTAGLASILGGTSSINFSTAEGNSRISRNVGNLIREESGIPTYTDQCGGSYFVESLTHQIIQECKKQIS